MLKRRDTILFIILLMATIVLNALQYKKTNIIYGFSQIAVYFIFIATLTYSVFRIVKDKRKISLFKKLSPFFLGLMMIPIFYLVNYLAETDGGKRRLITGGVDNDLSFIQFQLFTDSTFKLLNSGPFGGIYYRGTYTQKGDTLKLNNHSLKYLYPTLQLIRRQDNNKSFFEPYCPDDTLRKIMILYIQKDYRKQG